MKEIIQARLDRAAQKELERLVRRLGWSPSKIVREGIRLLGTYHVPDKGIRIVGLGKFRSGLKDLGSNKSRLKGFGK